MSRGEPKPIVDRSQHMKEDFAAEKTALQSLDLTKELSRACIKKNKGHFEIPHTECWQRFYNQPHRHVLNCGHVITTETIVACGLSCRLTPKATFMTQSDLIRCPHCLNKKKQKASPFMPRKKPRRNSVPAGRLAKIQASQPSPIEDEELIREQLAKANYPGYGGKDRRRSIFEYVREQAVVDNEETECEYNQNKDE